MKVDLSALAHEQVGSLHGRITRSVDGLVRFLRLSFLDFIPALLTGSFALTAALSKQPRVALAMAGVIPLSVALTIWQLVTQKGVRLEPAAEPRGDGRDGRRAAQRARLRPRRQHPRRRRSAASSGPPRRRRAMEIRHHFEMSLFGCGKALNEGFFHLLVIAFAIYLFVHGQILFGDILMFSVLYLNVMAPLNEIHRFIDEAHESSLKVGDLVDMLAQPVDRSFQPGRPARAPARASARRCSWPRTCGSTTRRPTAGRSGPWTASR